jgi:SAM domain (Sterile alpha motif)
MKEISDWLEKLGMSEYAERFADNKIDVSVLRHLTDQDLKDIGVPLVVRTPPYPTMIRTTIEEALKFPFCANCPANVFCRSDPTLRL